MPPHNPPKPVPQKPAPQKPAPQKPAPQKPAPQKPAGPKSAAEPRAWQRMLSGRRLNLLDPSPIDIEIEDIAHGLARMSRWNGQTAGAFPFSVASHSLLVTDIYTALYPKASREERLAALLHDGAEYVIGDLISPFKQAVGSLYKQLEMGLLIAIFQRFGIESQLSGPQADQWQKRVKRADRAAAFQEAICLAEFTASEAEKLWGKFPTKLTGLIDAHADLQTPPAPALVKQKFLARFYDLYDDKRP